MKREKWKLKGEKEELARKTRNKYRSKESDEKLKE